MTVSRGFGRILEIPEVNIGIFAFLLNYPWEFLQVPFFAGMAAAPHWPAVLFCTRAAAGDAAIAVAAYWIVAAMVRRRAWVTTPNMRHVVGFVAAGLVITTIVERLATEVWNRWEYAAIMPTLPVLGTGVVPLLQWIVLPPLVVWFVRRQLAGSGPG